ncbi:hypothetical protein HYQ46_006424 [Verticillium longisporum]|nr:hypothetical protein HYQ46_006424 [Verticillium longisporum]
MLLMAGKSDMRRRTMMAFVMAVVDSDDLIPNFLRPRLIFDTPAAQLTLSHKKSSSRPALATLMIRASRPATSMSNSNWASSEGRPLTAGGSTGYFHR